MSGYDTDGKCAVVQPGYQLPGVLLRCQHDFGHEGDHSWAKYSLDIFCGITHDEIARKAAEGSPSAQAMAQGIIARREKEANMTDVREMKAGTFLEDMPLVTCPSCGKTAIDLGIEQSEKKDHTYAHVVTLGKRQNIVEKSCDVKIGESAP